MKVPKGQPRIARRFNAGFASPNFIESRRDDRKCPKCPLKSRILFRLSGLFLFSSLYPRLKPWAIIFRLSEAQSSASEPAELGRLESRKTLFRQRMERQGLRHK
jgi:hypothetical protein